MSINSLQLPPIINVPQLNFAGLDAIGDAIAEYRQRGALADALPGMLGQTPQQGNSLATLGQPLPSAVPNNQPAASSPSSPSVPSNAGPISDQSNRPSFLRGKLDAFGKQWDFGSGGGGNESIPLGDFPITPGAIGPWGKAHGSIGINNNTIPDAKLGRDRTGIEIHAATNPDLFTKGCMAIAGDQWPQFRQELMRRTQNGEKLQLHVGADGYRITSSSGDVVGQSQGGGGNPQIASADPNFVPSGGSSSQQLPPQIPQPNITSQTPVNPSQQTSAIGAQSAVPQGAAPGAIQPNLSGVPPQTVDRLQRMIRAGGPAQKMAMAMIERYVVPQKPEIVAEGGAMVSPSGQVIYKNEPKLPSSALEYKYYLNNIPPGQQPMDYATWSTSKARAGATQVSNNIDMGGQQSYDKQLAEGLAKSHASLSNGVEESQQRARDIAAMQGAIDQIQKNGGTTGGMGAEQILALKKTINAGANVLGIENPFNEADLSDREFLQKFNRQMAGAQAKGAVGSRVTNFEMANYLKSNPGLDMSITGNQRLLGIQAQIERRNIAVGNAIRQATAQAISKGQKIDPVTVQKILTDYDEVHHIQDPVTGQDLTQSYVLPEFQKPEMGNNAEMAIGHEQNINGIKIKRMK